MSALDARVSSSTTLHGRLNYPSADLVVHQRRIVRGNSQVYILRVIESFKRMPQPVHDQKVRRSTKAERKWLPFEGDELVNTAWNDI